MSLSVDLLSIFLLITLAQGFFIISILVIRHKLKPTQHLLLFFMVLVLCWFQAEFLSVRLPYDIPINAFYGTRYGAWLLLGPLFYFYVQSITGKQLHFSVKAVAHFAPFLLFVVIIPLFTEEFHSSRQVHYGMLTTFDPFNDAITFLQYAYATVFIFQFIHLLIYLSTTLSITRHYEKSVRANYSTMNSGDVRWLKIMSLLLLLAVTLISVFLILFFIFRSYNRDLDYLYVIPSAVLIYLISYRLGGVHWLTPPLEKPGKYEKSSLKIDEAKEYSRRLEQYLAEHKPYLNNELRLQDLSEMVNIPLHHLSQLINETLHSTFFDLINRYRVEEAKKLILSGDESTLLAIAFKAGFNNKTSFTNAFKKFANQTPAEFRKSRKQ